MSPDTLKALMRQAGFNPPDERANYIKLCKITRTGERTMRHYLLGDRKPSGPFQVLLHHLAAGGKLKGQGKGKAK